MVDEENNNTLITNSSSSTVKTQYLAIIFTIFLFVKNVLEKSSNEYIGIIGYVTML